MPKAKKKTKTKESAPKKIEARKNFFTKRNGIILLIIIIAAILLYFFKGLFIAATVNGQPVTRLELIQELEKKSGRQTLDSLITKNIILQEMKKKKITVSDSEVENELKKIETVLSSQGRTLPEALEQQGLTKEDLMDQLRIQKMIEKLFAKEINVTDKEIDKYIEGNKDALPANKDEKTLRASVLEQLKQQKLTSKFQSWLEEIQKNAKINRFVNF